MKVQKSVKPGINPCQNIWVVWEIIDIFILNLWRLQTKWAPSAPVRCYLTFLINFLKERKQS